MAPAASRRKALRVTPSAAAEESDSPAPVEDLVEHPAARTPTDDAQLRADSTTITGPRKPWWKHAWAAFGVVVGVVGAVTGVIGILPLLFPDSTRPESLTVTVEPVTSEFAPVFAVPLTADWSGFPSSEDHCSPAQREWLSREGSVLTQRYLVSLRNDAGSGATMSLSSFRGRGTSTPGATALAVVCDETGAGSGGMRAAQLDPANGDGAVYVQRDPSAPSNPLVFNLAPGESGQFALMVRSSAAFVGDIVFTGSVGSTQWVQAVPLDGELDVPGIVDQRLVVVDGRLTCEAEPGCDVTSVLQAAREAAGIT